MPWRLLMLCNSIYRPLTYYSLEQVKNFPPESPSMANNQTSSSTSGHFGYLILKPENGGFTDLFRLLLKKDPLSGTKFVETSSIDHEVTTPSSVRDDDKEDDDDDDQDPPNHKWVLFVSILVRKIIAVFGKPLEWSGYLVEFVLNLLSHNGGFLGLLYNFIKGKIIIPKRGSETFLSAIGHLDERVDLYKNVSLSEANDESESKDIAVQREIGGVNLMDLCSMASKLAYENVKVVENVINSHWKMHFEEFYNCWNYYQKDNSTQVFIMCDRPKDANFILISFRGTEPFDADDWSTDFDYSWYQIPNLGKVHMGFLEALGLGSRVNVDSFLEHLQAKNTKTVDSETQLGQEPAHPLLKERTAYYDVRNKLKGLLQEHKNAKFLVTGHSLGGALAILFPVVLVLHDEKEVLKRLLAVYTFGQPRVGDRQLGRVMERELNHPVPKYFRVVYCNDLVPRLPYDDKTFLYKHFGECMYFNSFYVEQEVPEEPNPNYFGLKFLIPEYMNAVWELIRSFIIGYTRGPAYRETWESTMLRVVGLAIPGLAAHSPVDYVNSVRLGRPRIMQMSSL